MSSKIDELEKIVKENLEFAELELSEERSPESESVDEVIGYGMRLSAIIGTIAKTLADAKKLLNMRELQFMQGNKDLWDKPSVLKKMMEGTLADYYYYVLLADRLSAACTHKMDFYRTVVSKYKEELRSNVGFNQGSVNNSSSQG